MRGPVYRCEDMREPVYRARANLYLSEGQSTMRGPVYAVYPNKGQSTQTRASLPKLGLYPSEGMRGPGYPCEGQSTYPKREPVYPYNIHC
jgi:hypothetical protein